MLPYLDRVGVWTSSLHHVAVYGPMKSLVCIMSGKVEGVPAEWSLKTISRVEVREWLNWMACSLRVYAYNQVILHSTIGALQAVQARIEYTLDEAPKVPALHLVRPITHSLTLSCCY